jgi:hypothetical protein
MATQCEVSCHFVLSHIIAYVACFVINLILARAINLTGSQPQRMATSISQQNLSRMSTLGSNGTQQPRGYLKKKML